MALSYETYTSDGSTPNFVVPFDYIAKAHVFVTKNGVTAPFTWVSGSLINITGGVVATNVIRVSRTTPSTPLFNSADGAVLTNSNLQTLGRQAIFLTQENQDRADSTLAAAEEVLANIADVAGSASDALASESAAAASALSASGSAAAVAAAFDSFDDRYLGSKASAPALDNDGNALVAGTLYYDTVTTKMRQWDGAVWADVTAGLTQAAADVRYASLAAANDFMVTPTVSSVPLATRTATETLTNKTLTAPVINGGSLSAAVTGSTQVAGTNNTTLATTEYADALVAAGKVVARVTWAGGGTTILSSSNVASITRHSAGDYTVTTTGALPANATWLYGMSDPSNAVIIMFSGNALPSTTTIRLVSATLAGAAADAQRYWAVAFA